MKLRTLIDSGFDIGLRDYPLFDEEYRNGLNQKIIQHFYDREICCESAELFKLYLNRTLNEVMPLHNQNYNSCLIEYEPLITTDYTETSTRKVAGENTSNADTTNTTTDNLNGSTSSESKGVSSDTPQGLLSMGSIEKELYATKAEIGKGSNQSTAVNTSNGNSSSTQKGKSAQTETLYHRISGNLNARSNSELIIAWRKTFMNIDIEVLTDLEPCFLQIF